MKQKMTAKNEQVAFTIPVEEVPQLPGDLGRNIQIYYKDEFYQFKMPIHYVPSQFILLSEILYEKVTGQKSSGIF
ncbi:hypothetical protein [Acholeplasma laidlawii]|nr:hypothetical protein [Acholeplasma laidlawii]NWH10299.1 hypothetical protein [Acholeplasma laidlawii]NWH11687.1 hypothetical protein [Acholeplasma laidlawii]NWH12905.1 hypothetical protein [Acholeplasma laidlawii]NWH14495.1 hypothetical protein [Acholeplasma laidlawii]OAN20519.1 hypothetical protein A2I99_00360 [Acholeplasma laidlawii]